MLRCYWHGQPSQVIQRMAQAGFQESTCETHEMIQGHLQIVCFRDELHLHASL